MNKLCERTRSERAQKIFAFLHSKTAISCQYFVGTSVGTNDMLVGLHVPTQNSEKNIIGVPPPPPSGYVNGWQCQGSRYMIWGIYARSARQIYRFSVFYVELNALYYFHCV